MNHQTLIEHWSQVFSQAPHLLIGSDGLIYRDAIIAVVFWLFFFFVYLPFLFGAHFLGRKLVADVQARVGPNRVGLAGLFQNSVDLVKLLQKDNINSVHNLKWVVAAVVMVNTCLFTVPFSEHLLFLNTDLSILLPLFVTSLLPMLELIRCFPRIKVGFFLSAVRNSAQVFTALLPALIIILTVGITTGSINWTEIIRSQEGQPGGWNIFSTPFLAIDFFIFIILGQIASSRFPFDSTLSASEVSTGLAATRNGLEFYLFNFARNTLFVVWITMAVALFLGGWKGTEIFSDSNELGIGVTIAQVCIVLFKTGVIYLASTTFSQMLPRFRSDQTTDFLLRIISPLAFLMLIANLIWLGWRNFL